MYATSIKFNTSKTTNKKFYYLLAFHAKITLIFLGGGRVCFTHSSLGSLDTIKKNKSARKRSQKTHHEPLQIHPLLQHFQFQPSSSLFILFICRIVQNWSSHVTCSVGAKIFSDDGLIGLWTKWWEIRQILATYRRRSVRVSMLRSFWLINIPALISEIVVQFGPGFWRGVVSTK